MGFGLSRFKAFKVQGLGVFKGSGISRFRVVQACGFSDSGFSRSRFPKVQGFQGSGFPGSVVGLGFQGSRLSRFRV